MANNKQLSESKITGSDGWTWQKLANGGILKISVKDGNSIVIK